jgi:hypothetical protein
MRNGLKVNNGKRGVLRPVKQRKPFLFRDSDRPRTASCGRIELFLKGIILIESRMSLPKNYPLQKGQRTVTFEGLEQPQVGFIASRTHVFLLFGSPLLSTYLRALPKQEVVGGRNN